VIRRALDDLLQDTRYTLRWCARDRGFAGIVIATLALGIGVNTAIFSVVHAVLIDPLPFGHAERLMALREHVPAAQSPTGTSRRLDGMDVREFLELESRSRTLSHVASLGLALVTVQGSADTVRQELTSVSAAAFPMLGVQPLLGRWFLPDDEIPGRDRVIILSYGAWQRDFAGDPAVLGKTLTFNGNVFSGNVALGSAYVVVGVMPAAFHFPDDGTQAWVPFKLTPPTDGRSHRTAMMARLADGVSPDAAAAEVRAIVESVRGTSATARAQTSGEAPRFELVRVQDEVGSSVKPALTVLTGAVGVVLLIACANVANLLLARTAAREREIAVRLAIGAGRGRLIRQLLTEATVLSVAGGAAGTLLAFGGVRLFRGLATGLVRVDLGSLGSTFPRLDAIGLNASVFAFAVVVSVGTGLLFGLAPALRSSTAAGRVDSLRGATGSTPAPSGGRRGYSAQGALVVAEIAMTTALVIGGALLLRSFVNLATVDRGYDASEVLTFQVSLPADGRSSAERIARAEDLVARLRLLAGVQAAAYANQLPMVALENSLSLRTTPASPVAPPAPSPTAPDVRLVSSGYLQVMGIRVIAGRGFRDDDVEGRPRVLLINQTLARRDFASGNPVGTMVYLGRDTVPWEIVGVVADVRQRGLDREPRPQFFVSLRQWSGPSVPVFPVGAYYALRTSIDPASMIGNVRRVVHEIDSRAALENIATMDQVISNWMTRPRMYAVLLGMFAGLAIALAAAGIYGVMAYSVTQRTREIGIRMALGAQRPAVMRLVLGQSLALVAVGLTIGLAGAAGVTRYLEGLLFGLTPLDASTFAGAAVLFGSVAVVASYLPARSAATVDPMVALRAE
jgi:putative ABC transport system permease protein